MGGCIPCREVNDDVAHSCLRDDKRREAERLMEKNILERIRNCPLLDLNKSELYIRRSSISNWRI